MTYGTRRKRARRQYTPHPQITDDHPSASHPETSAAGRLTQGKLHCISPDADHVPLRRARVSFGGAVVG